MVDFAISLDFFTVSLLKVSHNFVIGCSLIECRPRGYLVNQCLEQQSRSTLSPFPQYRLQLGVVKFYNFLYCEIWEAVENLYEDIILLPRIRILNYDSNEICTIRKQNKMLPTDVVDTSKYSDYPAKLLVHYEMESKH
ncbi:hypothetical protein T06_7553 [Trichinella sp. T6]|nr:hypothetical protein T06_7553 [Trichinella sp. T6]